MSESRNRICVTLSFFNACITMFSRCMAIRLPRSLMSMYSKSSLT